MLSHVLLSPSYWSLLLDFFFFLIFSLDFFTEGIFQVEVSSFSPDRWSLSREDIYLTIFKDCRIKVRDQKLKNCWPIVLLWLIEHLWLTRLSLNVDISELSVLNHRVKHYDIWQVSYCSMLFGVILNFYQLSHSKET